MNLSLTKAPGYKTQEAQLDNQAKYLGEAIKRAYEENVKIDQGSRDSVKTQIPMTLSRYHWLFSFTVFPNGILTVYSHRIFKRQFPNNLSRVNAPSIHLGNHIHSIQSRFTRTCISFIQHGKIIQPSSVLNSEMNTIYQTINTASSTQYREIQSFISILFFLLKPLKTHFGRSTSKEGRKRAQKSSLFSGVVGGFPGTSNTIYRGPGENGEEEEENSVEEEESYGTEGVPAPVEASQGTGGPTLSQSNQPAFHQFEPSLLAIMQQMTQIMTNLQKSSSLEGSRPPAFKIPFMKAPECFYDTQSFKVRSFIQSCQLIFHNYPENLSQDRKKVLYATSFLIGRAAK
ncbi:hypothetical protein O181_033799 [Austropuccinia psidii MF-1]|uniref:Uncharacterized protein n=1 Tax=Austropuccinia psidii MF-1 TaxID=1389203 RepID=A0A9Q3CZG6_9BASI|nr:hypothetical protein [Austropuccinia psidii MF-1]